VTRSTDEGDGRAGEDPRDPGPGYSVTDKRRFAQDGGAGRSEEPSVSAPAEEEPGEVGDDLAVARSQAAEYLAHLQRLQAEFDNYRKRILREQTRAVEMASEPLARRLLEVLDEFDLALMAAERRPDFEQFLHGVELVYAKLLDILRAEGLERIEAEGKPFDPERHEALMQAHEGEGEPYVADVLRQGYTLKGRVIRPAGVKVGRK
jgi:molecular chaperone GrpE